MSREGLVNILVTDHLHPRNFAADVMLFDRLVFPVPEQGRLDPYIAYDPHLPFEWKRDEAEWSRWEVEGWPANNKSGLKFVGACGAQDALEARGRSGGALQRRNRAGRGARAWEFGVPGHPNGSNAGIALLCDWRHKHRTTI